MSEWLLSRDFQEYRAAEIREGAVFFGNILLTKHDSEYFKGVTDMLREIVKLPMKMAQTKEEKDKAQMLVKAAFDQIEARILRAVVLEE
ncbi:MAG: hypothetical protein WC455_17395 [Dehalococcoidia bacterium]|jgi:hypothetical protein